jgi:hypothetical protein
MKAGQTQNGMSGKSEIQLNILGLNVYCDTTSSFVILVNVSMLKKDKDVKKALYLILSDLLHILRIKTSAETVH